MDHLVKLQDEMERSYILFFESHGVGYRSPHPVMHILCFQ